MRTGIDFKSSLLYCPAPRWRVQLALELASINRVRRFVSFEDFQPTETFPQALLRRARETPDEVALRGLVRDEVVDVSWSEYLTHVTRLALSLERRGIRAGDRVAVMAATRVEWAYYALAAQSIGAIPVGVYATNSPAEVRQLMSHSGAKAFVGERAEHLNKLREVIADLPEVVVVAGIESVPGEFPGTIHLTDYATMLAEGGELDAATPQRFATVVAEGKLDDTAVLFYTSGTTGLPKGVMHSFRTLAYSAYTTYRSYPDSNYRRYDMLGFLPVAHVAPALLIIFAPLLTKIVVTYWPAERFEEGLRVVRPTFILWPPRFYEKTASAALSTVAGWPAWRRRLYNTAMHVGRRMATARWSPNEPKPALRLAYAASLRWVFLPLRATVGLDRLERSWTASAPMTASVQRLWQIWGVDLRELYGVTESCGTLTGYFDTPFPPPGGIGPMFPDPRWEWKTSDDGEFLVRSPVMFTGYWQNPKATAEVMSEAGWYRTGDIVDVDDDGTFRLVGRKKDIIITSGGKTVSPLPIESRLKESPLISEAVVVGEGKKFLSVLLEVDRDAVARGEGAADDLAVLLQAEVDRVNGDLARAEQLKSFRVLPRPLALETGERTANGKIRRDGIVVSFADLIDDMYGKAEAHAIESQAH